MPTLLVNENFPVPALKLLRAQGVQAEAAQELKKLPLTLRYRREGRAGFLRYLRTVGVPQPERIFSHERDLSLGLS